MWIDRTFFEGSFAKAAPPPPGCLYRVLLLPGPGAPSVPGVTNTSFFALNGLAAREAGTVIRPTKWASLKRSSSPARSVDCRADA
jgi:hypothetical protein